MVELEIEKSWNTLLKSYGVPTFAKKDILEPLFIKQIYLEPVLDAGCGTGFFSNLLAERGLDVISIDKNLDETKLKVKRVVKVDIEKFDFKGKEIGDILLINVLSCVESKKRIAILKNLKRIKSPASRIFVINTSEKIGRADFKSEYIQVKKVASGVVHLINKKIDNTFIEFDDYLIGSDEFLQYCDEVGLTILSKDELCFPTEKNAIFDFFVLR
jgi:SAM-dependent methyltransferase